MVKYEDILAFEIMRFKQDYNIIDYNDEDAIRLLRVALADALAYAARRKKTKYADNANSICQDMLKIINKKLISNKETTLKALFDLLVSGFQNHECLTKFKEDGYALKFASMVFKYLYCFDDIRKEYGDKFDECYLPLDSNTLNWYKKMSGRDVGEWSKLDKDSYKEIQEDIQKIIEKKSFYYSYKLLGKNEPVQCKPNNRLKLDFIMWSQEKYENNSNVNNKTHKNG